MRAYLSYFKVTFLNNTVYRTECLLGILNTCLQIFISCAIWKALYRGNTEIGGITFSMTVTNFILVQGLSNAFSIDDLIVQRKLYDGSISTELLKPIDFKSMLLAINLGNILFKLLMNFLPSAIIVSIFIGILPPASTVALLLFLVSIGLGFSILWSISLIVQMTAFWIINVWSVSTIKNVIVNVLAGATLPLWFMPDIVLNFINYTPFASIYFVPVQIYLGQIGITEVGQYYIRQILWTGALYAIGTLLWSLGRKRIIVQGG